ncbi:gag-pol polyprotein [Hordeum vulgare]|nr:gag-pol polyprotein [Hordeum vulgare]
MIREAPRGVVAMFIGRAWVLPTPSPLPVLTGVGSLDVEGAAIRQPLVFLGTMGIDEGMLKCRTTCKDPCPLSTSMKMKKALRQARVDDPIWMKFHFMMVLNNDITKTILLNNYESLKQLYICGLKVKQELKTKATRPRAHFMTTNIHVYEHVDGTTKMSKPDKLQEDFQV